MGKDRKDVNYTMQVGPVTAVLDVDLNWSLTAPDSLDEDLVDGLGETLTLETDLLKMQNNPMIPDLQWMIFSHMAERLATEWDKDQRVPLEIDPNAQY